MIGLLPVTGMQLPLISAGGTSTATTLLMIGMMANAARHEPEAVAALRAGRDDKVNRLLRLPLPEPYSPTRVEALRDRKRLARNRPESTAKVPPQAAPPPARKASAQARSPRGRRPNTARSAVDPADLATGEASWSRPAVCQSGSRQAPAMAARLAHWKVSVTGERHGQGADRRAGSPRGAALSVVLAGGGTAGHVEPAMAVADALVRAGPAGPDHRAGHRARAGDHGWCPSAATDLELITPVPLPRKPSGDLARLPPRVRRAVRQTRAVLDAVDADVVDRLRRIRGAARLPGRPRLPESGAVSRW